MNPADFPRPPDGIFLLQTVLGAVGAVSVLVADFGMLFLRGWLLAMVVYWSAVVIVRLCATSMPESTCRFIVSRSYILILLISLAISMFTGSTHATIAA